MDFVMDVEKNICQILLDTNLISIVFVLTFRRVGSVAGQDHRLKKI